MVLTVVKQVKNMENSIQRAIKRVFNRMLDWDLVKKTQLVLSYAIFLEIGLFLLKLSYMDQAFVSFQALNKLEQIMPIMIGITLLVICVGQLIKKVTRLHNIYSFFALLFYLLSILFLQSLVGLFHLISGMVLLSTLISLWILFPKKVVEKLLWGYIAGYMLLLCLNILGYFDLASGLQLKNFHFKEEFGWLYNTIAIFYSFCHLGWLICSSVLLTDAWQGKSLNHEIDTYSDPLTDLLNYKGSRKVTSLQLKQAFITRSELSVMILDIDNLARINQEVGYELGNEVLKHVGYVLRTSLRASDMIARFKGGTFLIVSAFTPLDKAQAVAEMCRVAVEQSPAILSDGRKVLVKASLGVTSTSVEDYDFDCLYVAAAEAMRIAKFNGKNQVCVSNMAVDLK